jgi:hypothetical protein
MPVVSCRLEYLGKQKISYFRIPHLSGRKAQLQNVQQRLPLQEAFCLSLEKVDSSKRENDANRDRKTTIVF